MGGPGGRAGYGQDAGGLAVEREVERQVEEYAGGGQGKGQGGGAGQGGGQAAAGGVPAKGGGAGGYGDVEGEVPGVDEGQGAQGQGQSGGFARAAAEPFQAGRDGGFEEGQRQAEGQYGKGERRGVGVEVAQEEAEEGHFGDGVVQRGAAFGKGVDDAAAAPPPPVALGQPPGGGLRGGQQALDAEPFPESGAAPAAGVGEFQHTGAVAEEYDGQGGGNGGGQGNGKAGAGEAQQVVDQANEAGGKQGGYGGHGQVIGGVGGYASEGSEHSGDEVAAVVVGDGVSGQPLVLGGKAVGVDDGVHNAEVHRFFGVVDGGRFADEQGPEGEYGQKGELDGDD